MTPHAFSNWVDSTSIEYSFYFPASNCSLQLECSLLSSLHLSPQVVLLEHVGKFFKALPIKRWTLIPLPLTCVPTAWPSDSLLTNRI